MAFIVRWENDEKTIMLVSPDAPYAWPESIAAFQGAYEMIRAVEHEVILIYDARLSQMPSLPAFQHYHRLFSMTPHNIRRFIVVGASPISRQLTASFARAVGQEHRVRFVDSVEEAQHLLDNSRNSTDSSVS